jgi:hypothetical protein
MTIVKGMFFVAVRNDGRKFSGEIENVRETAKGTMVVIFSLDNNYSRKYATVYLSECENWEVSDFAIQA